MPAEGVFSQVKSIMKENHKLFHVCSAPRALIAMAFGMVSVENCHGHISRCRYIKLLTYTLMVNTLLDNIT